MFESFPNLIRPLFFVFFVVVGAVGCDSPTQREGRLYPPTTVGKRLNETIQQNVKGSACEAQRRELLDKNQVALVQNVDFLLSRFEQSKPDENLLAKRLKWVKDNELEALADKLAGLIDKRKHAIAEDLTTLFGDTLFSLPTKEEVLGLIAFLRLDELKTLEKNLNSSIAKWADPRNQESQEVAAIIDRLIAVAKSPEGRFLADTFVGSTFKQLPNEEQLHSLLELAFREELRTVLPLARSAANEFLRPTQDTTKELQAIVERFQTLAKTDEFKFMTQTLLGDNFLAELSTDDIYKGIELARRKDLQSLIPVARQAMLELAHPTRAETTELLEILDRLKHFMAEPSVEGATKEAPAFVNLPTEAQFLNILPLLHQMELAPLLSATETQEALAIAKRLHAFTKTADGALLLSFTKEFITDAQVRKTLLDLADVLETKERFSQNYERVGIGLLFGEGRTSSVARAFCSVYLGYWYSIDKDILNRLFDFGMVLYKGGVIDDLLRLEEIANELALKVPANTELAKQIATLLEIKLTKPTRSQIEDYLLEKKNQDTLLGVIEKTFAQDAFGDVLKLIAKGHLLAVEHSAEVLLIGNLADEALGFVSQVEQEHFAKKLYVLLAHFVANKNSVLLNPQVAKDVLRLNELSLQLESKYEKDIALLLKLADDYNLSLQKLTKERVSEVLVFVKEKDHQKAFEIIKQLSAKEGFLDDLLQLDVISQKFLAEQEQNVTIIQNLARSAGYKFELPPREKVGAALAFVTNPKNQAAAIRLGDSVLEFAMFFVQAQKQFASFPMPKVTAQSQQSIFEPLDKVKEEDFSAAWELLRLGFGVWSLSPESQCKIQTPKDSIGPQQLTGALTQLSIFLTTPENGLKSWLALIRRAAHDTKS